MKTQTTVRIPVVYTDEALQDIMSTAMYGGINYWALIERSDTPLLDRLVNGGDIVIHDCETFEETWTLNRDNLEQALTREIQSGRIPLVKNDEGETVPDISGIDADAADRLIQLAAIGEITFG